MTAAMPTAQIEIGLVQAFGGTPKHGPAYVRDFSQAAEALGFHSIWAPEHIVFFEEYDSVYPYPQSQVRPNVLASRSAARPASTTP